MGSVKQVPSVEEVFSRPLREWMAECLGCGGEPVGLVSREQGSDTVFMDEPCWPCRTCAERIVLRLAHW